jgi:hypothetical protein
LLPATGWCRRGEQRLSGHQALAGTQQLAEEAALLGAAIAEHRVHRDAGIHEHHAAGFANARLARVQLQFHELHLCAADVVVDHVHAHGVLRLSRWKPAW